MQIEKLCGHAKTTLNGGLSFCICHSVPVNNLLSRYGQGNRAYPNSPYDWMIALWFEIIGQYAYGRKNYNEV